jgi:hypothetical protein
MPSSHERRLVLAALLCILVFLLSHASALHADNVVTFAIFGRVQFSVPPNWPVVSSKSGPTKTIFAFQIPNSADKHTPDSTNLAIIAYYLGDADAKAEYEKKKLPQDPKAQPKEITKDWNCTSFEAMQKATQYTVVDCSRTVEPCGVYVRLAWPHLKKNAPDYDAKIQATLVEILESVGPSSTPVTPPKASIRINDERMLNAGR